MCRGGGERGGGLRTEYSRQEDEAYELDGGYEGEEEEEKCVESRARCRLGLYKVIVSGGEEVVLSQGTTPPYSPLMTADHLPPSHSTQVAPVLHTWETFSPLLFLLKMASMRSVPSAPLPFTVQAAPLLSI